jgi:hypothetical protein
MHDCHTEKDQLVDLVFGELESREKSARIAELKGCHSCYSLYLSMDQTIRTLDQMAEAALPEESYWTGYEARLQARLNEAARPNLRQVIAGWGGFDWLLAMPRAFRYGLAFTLLAVLSLVAFNSIRSRVKPSQLIVAETAPNAQKPDAQKPNTQENAPQKNAIARVVKGGPSPSRLAAVKPGMKTDVARKLPVQLDAAIAAAVRAAQGEQQPGMPSTSLRRATPVSALSGEVARHLEKTQLLLRSFRNIGGPGVESGLDISYEKELSKELVSNNRLLRRSAERKQRVFVEDLLSSIEPLLLDIANLPDKPLADDVRAIKDLIRKQEVVATLQFYSAKNSRNTL